MAEGIVPNKNFLCHPLYYIISVDKIHTFMELYVSQISPKSSTIATAAAAETTAHLISTLNF